MDDDNGHLDREAVRMLIGLSVRKVVFIMNYLQVVFERMTVQCVTEVVVVSNGQKYDKSSLQFEDILCEQISKCVTQVYPIEDEHVGIEFSDGTCIFFNLKDPEYTGPEKIVIYDGRDIIGIF